MFDILELNKIHHLNCLDGLKMLENNSIDLIVTSPPYYNAREYALWESFDSYMNNMKEIFTEAYRVLKNHKYIVVNVSDIISRLNERIWSTRKIPLGAYFTIMLEEIGFIFSENYIWDKGEPQTKRHLGNPPYPFYQYPVNCYEYILVFSKQELNMTRVPCPVCHSDIVVSNGLVPYKLQSWECKNPECHKTGKGRGKRYSSRSILMNEYQKEENFIPKDFISAWRRDIVKINPVIKINAKGENKIKHTAPYPESIPEMAIRYYSGVNDIVLDIFTGSGTSQKVAKKLGRNYLGFEIHEEYVNLANENINSE